MSSAQGIGPARTQTRDVKMTIHEDQLIVSYNLLHNAHRVSGCTIMLIYVSCPRSHSQAYPVVVEVLHGTTLSSPSINKSYQAFFHVASRWRPSRPTKCIIYCDCNWLIATCCLLRCTGRSYNTRLSAYLL